MLEPGVHGGRATKGQAGSRHLVGPAGLEMGLGTWGCDSEGMFVLGLGWPSQKLSVSIYDTQCPLPAY